MKLVSSADAEAEAVRARAPAVDSTSIRAG